MKIKSKLRLAIQKNGRLNNDSMDLLSRCGLKIRISKNSLLCHAENLPIDVLFVRDDDIPSLILNNTCDLGIVGQNVLLEQTIGNEKKSSLNNIEIVKKLGFSRCRLSIALPDEQPFDSLNSLQGLRIATSHPNLLQNFLKLNNIDAEIMVISGSVEIAPGLDMSDAICDLVSTGRTLEENNLKEVANVIKSEAVLIKSPNIFNLEKNEIFELLTRRIESVLKAQESKYIMFHVPRSSIPSIKNILPGFETPTIMPLEGFNDKVAIHVVSPEAIFWITLEKLKQAGASAILVLPIEKMLS